MKQYLLFALVLAVGVALGMLLSSTIVKTDDGEESAAIDHQRIRTPEAADTDSGLVSPSPIDPSDQTTFSHIKAVVLEAETLTLENLQRKLLTAIGEFETSLTYPDQYLSRIYLKRMVSLDPTETIEFLNAEPALARHFFHYAFCDWVSNDLEGALQYFLSAEQSVYLKRSWHCFVRHPEIQDHPEFERLAERSGPDFSDQLELQQLHALMPSEAFDKAQSLRGDLKQRAMMSAARRWADQDLVGFLQVFSELPQSSYRHNIILSSLQNSLMDNPIPTLRLIETYLPLDASLVRNLLGNVVRNLSFAEARNFVEEYATEADDQRSIAAISDALFESDPEQALEFFEGFSLSQRQGIYANLGHRYASHNQDDALSWGMSLDNDFNQAKQNVFRGVARQDLSYLEQVFLSLDASPSMNRRLMFGAIVQAKSQQDPGGAVEWITDYESEPGYDQAVSTALGQWIYKAPWAAGEYIKETLGEERQVQSMRQLIRQMMSRDSQRAEQYVDSLPAGNVKQQAISGLALAVSGTDPERAYSIVEDLQDQEARDNVVWRIATVWASREPDRIDEISDLMALSAEKTAQLRSRYLGLQE